MAKASKPERDLHAQPREFVSDLPDETEGNRPMDDDDMPMHDDRWHGERAREMPIDADQPDATQTGASRGASSRESRSSSSRESRGSSSGESRGSSQPPMRAKGANQKH